MSLADAVVVAPREPSADVRRRAMRVTVLAQCAGMIGSLVFTNGLLLLYLQSLGVSSAGILAALSLNELTKFLMLPAAHASDRRGIRRIGSQGMIVATLGFGLLALAGWLPGQAAVAMAVTGMLGYAVGNALFNAGWFALLAGFVPEDVRGRFFGMLRFSWQMTAIAITWGCSWLLGPRPPLWAFQIVMGLIAVGQMVRLVLYRRIPEFGQRAHDDESLMQALRWVAHLPQYLPFCAYVFLLALFTAGAPALLGLVEAKVLLLTDRAVVMLGAATMLGFLVGFASGGFAVDRLGSKAVFLLCHFAFAGVLCLYPLRGCLPAPTIVVITVLHLLYGAISAASSIAVSTEMLALVPAQRRSISTALCVTLQAMGAALSGLLAAGAVKLGFLQERWLLLGTPVSQYDAILMGYGVLVALLVVALGLVPSVLGKAQWVPRDA